MSDDKSRKWLGFRLLQIRSFELEIIDLFGQGKSTTVGILLRGEETSRENV